MIKKTALLAIWLVAISQVSLAAFMKPSSRHDAGGNKTGKYFEDGFFAGGEHTVTAARLKDIRRAKSDQGFERIVLDLQAQSDDKDSIPYFQIQAAPEEGRYILSLWANVMYDFDVARINKSFSKSAHFKRVNIMPRLEEGLAIIEFTLNPELRGKNAPKFEVFRLSRPSRIIMDVL